MLQKNPNEVLGQPSISPNPLSPKIVELEKSGMNVGIKSYKRLREGKKCFVKCLLRL